MKNPLTIPTLLLAALLGTVPIAAAQPDSAGFTITGVITHYQPGKAIYIALFSSAWDFEHKKRCMSRRFLPDKLPTDSLRYEFIGVKPGEYVIAVYQDLNGDAAMNMGLFGPTEPYLIYLPRAGRFGPKFDVCKFRVDGDVRGADLRF